MEETAEPITAANLTSLAIADDVRTGGWIRRLQPERPVRTMTVVVVDIDPKDLLPGALARRSAASQDTRPVPSGSIAPRRRSRWAPAPGDQHLGAVRAEHIKATGELRVAVAEHKAQSSP